MENDIVALKCPNCGSNDVVAESETAAVCRRCGGRFVMQKQQGPVYVKNEIFMGGGSGYTKKNMTFPVVNDAVSFKRAAIVNLMKDERTPVDLLDAEFAPVRTDVNQFLAVEADVDTTYSAMVGTDHFENRIQYSKNMMGETVAKQVTVTVTDWQPFNGMKRCSETGVIALKTKGDERDEIDSFVSFAESEAFSEAIPAEEESANLEEPIVPTDKQIQSARLCAEEAAKQECRRDLPGDHYKDFRATAVSTIRSSVVYL
ncbi:MAG: TFIIB-type zinc ribbon-containing protein, partial [Eubacteriales bacterium]